MAASTLSVLDGTGASATIPVTKLASGAKSYQTSGDSSHATYAASKNQLTPVAAIKTCFILAGSATMTVRVRKVVLSGIATAAGETPFKIYKSSDAGTLGSAVLTTLTATPLDSGFAAATAVFSSVGTAVYTTEPAIVGTPIITAELALAATTTGNVAPLVFDFGRDGLPCIVLRGVAQCLCIDFVGGTVPSGGKYSASIIWHEDDS